LQAERWFHRWRKGDGCRRAIRPRAKGRCRR
jgi:hypothetical protein